METHVSKKFLGSDKELHKHEAFCGIEVVVDMAPGSVGFECLNPWWGWRASCQACVIASRHLWRGAIERLYSMALRAEPVEVFGDQLSGIKGEPRHVIDQWKEQFALCCAVDGVRMCTLEKDHAGAVHIDGWRTPVARWSIDRKPQEQKLGMIEAFVEFLKSKGFKLAQECIYSSDEPINHDLHEVGDTFDSLLKEWKSNA